MSGPQAQRGTQMDASLACEGAQIGAPWHKGVLVRVPLWHGNERSAMDRCVDSKMYITC